MAYRITREQAVQLAEAAGVRRSTPRYTASAIIKAKAMAALDEWCARVPMINNPASKAHILRHMEWQVLTRGSTRLDIDGHTASTRHSLEFGIEAFDVRVYRIDGGCLVNMADGSRHVPMATSWQRCGTVIQYEDTAADTVERLYRSVYLPDASPDWVIDTRGEAIEIRAGYGTSCWAASIGAGDAARLTIAARAAGFNVEVLS